MRTLINSIQSTLLEIINIIEADMDLFIEEWKRENDLPYLTVHSSNLGLPILELSPVTYLANISDDSLGEIKFESLQYRDEGFECYILFFQHEDSYVTKLPTKSSLIEFVTNRIATAKLIGEKIISH